MVAAAALREENVVAATALSRSEVIARYRTLREISKRHHSKVMDFLSPDAKSITDRKSTRLNSSHITISYAVFCLKKKKKKKKRKMKTKKKRHKQQTTKKDKQSNQKNTYATL